MIDLKDQFEAELWNIILDSHDYAQDDTKYFLLEVRKKGVLDWMARITRRLERDLELMRDHKGLAIRPETIKEMTKLRKIAELLEKMNPADIPPGEWRDVGMDPERR